MKSVRSSRTPQLLTYDVGRTIAPKVALFEELLPGIDGKRVLAGSPGLLCYDMASTLPAKLRALESLFPGVDLPRLIRSSPGLLEYDVERTLRPRERRTQIHEWHITSRKSYQGRQLSSSIHVLL